MKTTLLRSFLVIGLLAPGITAWANHDSDLTVNYVGTLTSGTQFGSLNTPPNSSYQEADWWHFEALYIGQELTFFGDGLFGDGTVRINLQAYRGTTTEGAHPSTLDGLVASATGSSTDKTLTFFADWVGPGTLEVSEWSMSPSSGFQGDYSLTYSFTAIPEPGTVAAGVLFAGLLGFVAIRRIRQRRTSSPLDGSRI